MAAVAVRMLWRGSVTRGPAVDFPHLLGHRQKSTVSFLSRPDRPKLAYHKLKGKNPGVVFLSGLYSNMNGQKALALEDFCKSIGHAFVRFDYTGCGSSEGNVKESTVGKWRKDVLSVLDELTDGPQILVGSSLGGWLMLHAAIARPEKVAALVGIAAAADHLVATFQQLPVELNVSDDRQVIMLSGDLYCKNQGNYKDHWRNCCVWLACQHVKLRYTKSDHCSFKVKKEVEEKGEWKLPTKHSEEGFYTVPYEVIQEAENHCVLGTPLPIKCPVRLLHGIKDEDVPWQISLKIAERVVSTDVDIILRKAGQHRMKEQDDIKLIVYTVEDLIDKLTTLS